MPTHYAASELLIVLVALWTARALWRQNMGHGALGTLLFGTAAALGAVKFSLGVRHEGFIALHQLASQFGGLVGVMLFTHQLMTSSDILQKWVPRHRGFAALVALVAFVLPLARVPLFLIWSLGLIVLCATRTPQIALAAPVKAAMAAIMLLNVLVLRQAAWLTPAVSWHAFHIVVAVWLLAICALLTGPWARVVD